MKMIRRIAAMLSCFAVLSTFVLVSAALAQDPSIPVKPDINTTLAAFIAGLSGVLIPWVIYGFTQLLPKIPRVVLPFLPLVLGYVAENIVTWTSGYDNPALVALIALFSMILREVLNTWSAHGLKGGGGLVFAEK